MQYGDSFDGDKTILEYLDNNRNLHAQRPQCRHHGDYHEGNMILSPEGKLYIIDWHTVDFDNIGDPWYEFNKLSVLPSWRHYGYGKKMIDFCKEKVRELGGNKITLDIIEKNTVLKNWYAANGFVHIGTKKFEHLPFTTGYMEWGAAK